LPGSGSAGFAGLPERNREESCADARINAAIGVGRAHTVGGRQADRGKMAVR
jgi:hypothetical protein